jgi:hypothetical protein
MARPKVSTGLSGLLMAAVFAAATAISGCTTHIADSVPASVGGLPEHTPARAATPAEFPAVGDRPQPRAEGLLDEAGRKKLRDDLNASRDHATKLKSEPPANEQPAKKKLAGPAASKKKSESATTGTVSAAGAAPNP